MVNHFLRQNKKVLLVLHSRHIYGDGVPNEAQSIIQSWKTAQILRMAPPGHNDDWHWLYLTMCRPGRTLLVTNDEMRDHHFQMLAQRSFTR